MTNSTKTVSSLAQTSNASGTWTKVTGFTQVDGQSGGWFKTPNGDWSYYEPQNSNLLEMAFTACADLKNNSVLILINNNAPASGLQVSSGASE